MARDSVSVQVNVDVKAKMNDVESKISALQKELNNITLFDNTKKTGLESMIESARKQMQSVKQAAEQGLDLSNAGSSAKSLDALDMQLKHIYDDIKTIGAQDIKFHVDSDQVSNIKTQMKEAESAILSSANSSEKLKQALKGISDSFETGVNVTRVEGAFKALESNDFGGLKKNLDGLASSYQHTVGAVIANAKKSGQDADEAAQKYSKLIDVVKEFNTANTGADSDVGKLAQQLKDLDANAAEQIADNLKKAGEAAKDSGSGIDSMAQQIRDAADSTKAFESEMLQLTNRMTDFFGVNNAIDMFKNKVEDAWNTIKELDKSMTETATVTDFGVGDLWKNLPKYTKSANELGTSINDVVQGTTLYYQQGGGQNLTFSMNL